LKMPPLTRNHALNFANSRLSLNLQPPQKFNTPTPLTTRSNMSSNPQLQRKSPKLVETTLTTLHRSSIYRANYESSNVNFKKEGLTLQVALI
jgi:hypothetical protein